MPGKVPIIARLARILGLPMMPPKRVHVNVRPRGCSDAQVLPSLVCTLTVGGGHLQAVYALGADEGGGLCGAMPDSCRLRETWCASTTMP